MKLHTTRVSPSTFRVDAFLTEKGVEVPRQMLNIMEGDTRTPAFRRINSLGEVPVLELDDGTIITESVAICRYLEDLHPDPALMGTTPVERARVEMWNRRMEQQVLGPLAQVGLHSFELFATKVEQIPAYAESQKRAFLENWEWLDAELADGRTYVCDDRFSIADITGMAALIIAHFVGVSLPQGLPNARRWKDAVCSRSSMFDLTQPSPVPAEKEVADA